MNHSSAYRLTEVLIAEIEKLSVGSRIPSMRALQAAHQVGPGTIRQVITELARRGLVETIPGNGTFKRSQQHKPQEDFGWQLLALGPSPDDSRDDGDIAAERPRYDLSSGYLDSTLQPVGLLQQAAARSARRPEAWERPPLEGLPQLRSLFADELHGARPASEVLVTPGAQAALVTCFRSLAAPGEIVLMESPTYPGAIAAARSAGLQSCGIPTDEHGIQTGILARAFEGTGAKLVYAQPRWVNPSGGRMSNDRKNEVHDLLRRFDAFLIEDDCARDFDFSTSPYSPLVTTDSEGHVVYVRSLTRHSGPGLRIAALIASGHAFHRLQASRQVEGYFAASLLQLIACEILTAPTWSRHLRRIRGELRDRRDVLANAIQNSKLGWRLSTTPEAGVHLWCELPGDLAASDVVTEAAKHEIGIGEGGLHFPAGASGQFVRLSYCGASTSEILDAVDLLNSVFA